MSDEPLDSDAGDDVDLEPSDQAPTPTVGPGEDLPEEFDEESSEEPPEELVLRPPTVRDTSLVPFAGLYRIWKHQRNRERLIGDGYVQWYLVDGTFPSPRWIKPKARGGGVLEHEHGSQRYLFPREAIVPTEGSGAWTAVHKVGEADPLNLNDPSKHAIPADLLEEYLQRRVTTSPPSIFDGMDLDPKDVMTWTIVLFVVIAVVYGAVTGGLV